MEAGSAGIIPAAGYYLGGRIPAFPASFCFLAHKPWARGGNMQDLFYLVITLAFFAVCAVYVRACDRL